ALKLLLCLVGLVFSSRLRPALKDWSVEIGFREAAMPSMVFALQNFVCTAAYRRLDGVTFNVLSQTKLLFTALFALALRGRDQTKQQWQALLLIFIASASAVIGEGAASRGPMEASRADVVVGAAAALLGAALSGLGSVLSEDVLVQKQRDVLLFSAELAAGGILVVGVNLLLDLNGDGTRLLHSRDLFALWTPSTLLPVVTLGCGGILVGVVTKAVGSVRKALTVTVGLLLSAAFRTAWLGRPPSLRLCISILLVVAGMRRYFRLGRPAVETIDANWHGEPVTLRRTGVHAQAGINFFKPGYTIVPV
ncbi:unnamed protein product, partial [Polarella glacialis]